MKTNLSLSKVLSVFDDFDLFNLCQDFDRLSLEEEDTASASSSKSIVPSVPSSSYRSSLHRLIRLGGDQPFFNESISRQIKAPFIELPRHIVEYLSHKTYDVRLGLGFRFFPGQSQFLNHELNLSESFDQLVFLRKSLGLYQSKLSLQTMYHFCRAGAGLRGIATEGLSNKILVEVLSYFNGFYGRFIILYYVGVGCTVWYGFAPGNPTFAPDSSLFAPIASYEPFLNMDYEVPFQLGFSKMTFLETVESGGVSASVESAMASEPFAEVTIPANGPVLMAVSVSVMLAVFMATGIIPVSLSQG